MNTPTRIAVYVGSLAVAFGAATGIGYAVGPLGDDNPSGGGHGGHDKAAAASPATPGVEEARIPPGLQATQGGWTLSLLTPTAQAGRAAELRLVIVGADGAPLRSYATQHEKELHLIVVRRDLTGYQHLHPTRAADGVWSVPFTAVQGGSYKVFADFKPAGAASGFTLASDLAVAGTQTPAEPPGDARTVVVDGYTVTLTGTPRAGSSERLSFAISRDGRPVDDVEPYLGARGHMVALRGGDLAYLHVHPDGGAGDTVAFGVETPTSGTYRLFFEFKREGTVHLARFEVTTTGTTATPSGNVTAPEAAPDTATVPETAPAAEPADGHDH